VSVAAGGLRLLLAAGLGLTTFTRPASTRAGRPLITDDAGVVGGGALQLETWLRLDERTLEHWLMLGWGPIAELELTLGGVHGTAVASEAGYSATGPIAQAKALVREPTPAGFPGLALAAGVAPPFGFGDLAGDAATAYGYAAGTLSPFEADTLQFHANLGAVRTGFDGGGSTAPTWGGALVFEVSGPLTSFVEVVSGDPETAEHDGAVHTGVKLELGESAHLDATFGAGIWGAEPLPPFGTLGVRVATN
jgi:hypothetical protein